MDKRSQKTLDAIYEALRSLLSEKEYGEIKVADLLSTSHISRGAFYSHFKDKDDVLSSLCDNIFEHVFSIKLERESDHDFSKAPADSRHLLNHLAIHIYEDKEIIKAILSSSGKSVFIDRMTMRVRPTMEACVFSRELFKQGVPEKLQSLQLTDSFVSIISHWVLMGCIATPETIIDYFYILHS